jgi:hypothetical protein
MGTTLPPSSCLALTRTSSRYGLNLRVISRRTGVAANPFFQPREGFEPSACSLPRSRSTS